MSKEDSQMSEKIFQEFQTLIERIEQAESDDFFDLAKILNRDPKKDFAGADLSGTNLSFGNLISANLIDTDLSGADLSSTNLSNADLSGADLSGANLSNANLSGAEINNATKIDKKWNLSWRNDQKLLSEISEAKESIKPLEHEKLLQTVRNLVTLNKREKAMACGYYIFTKSGGKRVNTMKFLNALIDAEGIELNTIPNAKGVKGRNINYPITTVQSNGKLTISSDYVKQIGLQPGDELEITLGRKHIRLKMLNREVTLLG